MTKVATAAKAATKIKDDSGKEPEGTAAREAAPATQGAKRRPIQSFREGDVSASIWSREVHQHGKAVMFYSLSVERSYRDRDGSYRYTKNFDANDLGALLTVIQRSVEFISRVQWTPADAGPMPDQAE
jgi:hypothetical protein